MQNKWSDVSSSFAPLSAEIDILLPMDGFNQGPDFVNKAVDLAARELVAVATPGQGLVLTTAMFFSLVVESNP